jgi:hypothetical protein
LDWVCLDEARILSCGWDEALSDIFKSFRHVDLVTAFLESAPPHRLRLLRLTRTPSHIEEVLSWARGPIEFIPGNKLRALIYWPDPPTPARLFIEADTCTFAEVRVNWPVLAPELESRGWRAPAAQSLQRRGAYKGGLASFVKRLKPATFATLSDDDVARLFKDHVDAQVAAGKSVLKLPQLRNIANQVANLRPKGPPAP